MQNKHFLFLVLVILTGALISGCTHRTSHLTGSSLSPVAEINPEYEVISEVTGTGTATYSGLYPIPISLISISEGREIFFGFGPYKYARAKAVENAMNQNPDADTIIIYRIDEEKQGFLCWYKRSTVTVKAKAIKLK